MFEGVTGIHRVTRAMHICRGNSAEAWNAQGGYEAIAADLFPRLDVDVLLLEYDTPRAGDFGPLRHVLPQHHVVLGLLTTKQGQLEDADAVEARNPLSLDEQAAKLRLVARRVWS